MVHYASVSYWTETGIWLNPSQLFNCCGRCKRAFGSKILAPQSSQCANKTRNDGSCPGQVAKQSTGMLKPEHALPGVWSVTQQ